MSIQAIKKLENIADFLKNSNKISFQNHALPLFVDYIENEPELWIIMSILLDKNNQHFQEINNFFAPVNNDRHFSQYRNNNIKNFDGHVACCWFYLKIALSKFRGNPIISKFIAASPYNKADDKEELQKLSFYHECINPIILYLKLQIDHSQSAVATLKKYKILCEWYDREKIIDKKELSLTSEHLSKYLFNCGFTYSLTETNTNSGRIDNLAFSIGIDINQLRELPDIIVVEGKIFTGLVKIFSDVFSQIKKRLNDFNLLDGYCVIYNKTNKKINIQDQSGEVGGMSYVDIDGKKIFFIVINLGVDFLNSKKRLKEVDIKILDKIT